MSATSKGAARGIALAIVLAVSLAVPAGSAVADGAPELGVQAVTAQASPKVVVTVSPSIRRAVSPALLVPSGAVPTAVGVGDPPSSSVRPSHGSGVRPAGTRCGHRDRAPPSEAPISS